MNERVFKMKGFINFVPKWVHRPSVQITVSSSEKPSFEHSKIWCGQTLCWLSGERWLPIGLLVIVGQDFGSRGNHIITVTMTHSKSV